MLGQTEWVCSLSVETFNSFPSISVKVFSWTIACPTTFLDVHIALHLCYKNIATTLVDEETALVDLSDDAWVAANHPDVVEANDLDSRNATTTFYYCINHFLLGLLSQLLIWISARLKGRWCQNHIRGIQFLSEESDHRESGRTTRCGHGWPVDRQSHPFGFNRMGFSLREI